MNEKVIEMNNSHFEEAMRIVVFRGIARQLLENNLISQAEFNAIQQKLNKKEHMLIAGCQHRKSHAYNKSQSDQVPNGLDSFTRESND